MNENMNEYKDIINLMEATPKAPVPDHFTQNVMGRVAELDQGAWAKLKQALFNPSGAGVQSRWAQILSVSNTRECSFCFFITGFFYLIMGIVLIAGFKAIGSSMAATGWITLQPYLTIGAAMWLLSLGALLIMDGRAAVKIAQYGTLLYIFFTVFNVILMRPYLHVPFAGVFIIGFVATSAFMGVMLAFAVHKMELRPV
jgi:predicted neutral ceramidase superfamily lipid hydrolase